MKTTAFRKVYLPYCIRKIDKHRFLVLNRRHKPVGFNTGDWLRYEDYPVTWTNKKLTDRKLRELSYCGVIDSCGTAYLYNDGCVPNHSAANMKAYLKRLEILAKIIE